MSISTAVTKMRFEYHTNFIEVCNVLNQLHILPDKVANRVMKKHFMIVVEDVLPRMGIQTDFLFEEDES